MRYRRLRIEGATYFFTMVTYGRRKIFELPENIPLLRSSFQEIKGNHPFVVEAVVVLPDHLHCLLKLPVGDSDYPTRIRQIKSAFSRKYRRPRERNTASRQEKGEVTVWQRRYWEHTIRDDDDSRSHVEYIHYNPVKHGLVVAPRDWPFSSFHRFVKEGIYDGDWGAGAAPELGLKEEYE